MILSGVIGKGKGTRGSTLVIVLWIALGLVSVTLYFAQSMLYEIKAADNRVEGLAAEQAIDAGARYAVALIGSLETNGIVPGRGSYACAAVPLSARTPADPAAAKFWFIGRDTNAEPSSQAVSFGLVDEASKINLNSASSNMLYYLCDMDLELTESILDWRGSNGPGSTYVYYGMQDPPYECKQAPFESTGELGLVMGVTTELLYGEDRNRNGILDPDESDENRDGVAKAGLLGLVTVFSREPNTYSNGVARINIRILTSATSGFREMLENALGSGKADPVLQRLGISGGGGGGRGGGGQSTTVNFTSPLDFYRRSGLTPEEFALISDQITVVEGDYIEGRVNINTAPAAVLSCLPGLAESPDLVTTIINYRLSNPDKLDSVAWLVDAIGQNNEEVLSKLQAQDCITTRSYQFTADVAATGAFGRGYRRSQFVIDSSTGVSKVVYRQDLTGLGWALGKDVRDQLNSLTQNGNFVSR